MDASEHPTGTCGLCESLNKLYLWWLCWQQYRIYLCMFSTDCTVWLVLQQLLVQTVLMTAIIKRYFHRMDGLICHKKDGNRFSIEVWMNWDALQYEWAERDKYICNVLHSKPVVSSKRIWIYSLCTVYFPGIVAHYASKLNKEINTNILLVIYIIKEHNHFASKIQNTVFVVYFFFGRMNEWMVHLYSSIGAIVTQGLV